MIIWMRLNRSTGAVEAETRSHAMAQAWRAEGYRVSTRREDGFDMSIDEFMSAAEYEDYLLD